MSDKNDQHKNTFTGDLGKYQILETEDGSKTLHSEAFNEACHSLSGAVEETLYNYVEGCEILEKLIKNDLTCLEVGFGLGTGYKTTVEYLAQIKPTNKLTFISTELDAKLVEYATIENKIEKDLPYPDFSSMELRREPVEHYIAEKESHKLIILIGDARQTVLKAYESNLVAGVGAIYQDPFSPKKNPALWTVEWFELLAKVSSEDVTLSTYSSSNSIRKSLIQAGWKVFNRIGFGTKRTATKARLIGESDEEVLLQLGRSPVKALEDSDIK
ncbi:MAG: hypothetical protein EP319_14225 [Deltaproteobacteria bacterium]|nr:MAG: hypothetical protein EP319_14225 [Deltaproteobacteria bacterium]